MDQNQNENDENNGNVGENAKEKPVLFNGITGKVKWFNVKLGYGFVCRDDNQEDIFIHQSAIVKSNPDHPRKSVENGEDILFDIVRGIKGNEAANVCGADGNFVKGSEYALRFPRMRGRGRGRGQMRMESNESGMRTLDYFRGGSRGRFFRGRSRQTSDRTKKDSNDINESSKQRNDKPIILTGITGKVKWFNVKRGYGFVCRDDNQEDVFIHQSAIAKSNPDHPRKSVEDGEEILFDIAQGDKGNEASNVSAIDGNFVKGSEYALRYIRGRWGPGRSRGRMFPGRGRPRGISEEEGPHPQEMFREALDRPFIPRRPFRGGRPFMSGRPFRGGRPYGVPFIEQYNYEVPPEYFYKFDNYYDPARFPPRGRFNGPRFRGGPQRDGPGKFEVFDGEYFDRRPPMRGRPRGRGRGRSRGRGRGGEQWNSENGRDQQLESEQIQDS